VDDLCLHFLDNSNALHASTWEARKSPLRSTMTMGMDTDFDGMAQTMKCKLQLHVRMGLNHLVCIFYFAGARVERSNRPDTL
jgi:hypothetical protein